jgi:DNA polymerase-1
LGLKLLVDADYIAYKSCASAEDEINWGDDVITVVSRFSEAMSNVTRELTKIKNHFMWDVPELVLFFSDAKNFRKQIYSSYKGHRNRKKPCGYRRVINELGKQYEVIRLPELEADDGMGIYATKHPGNIIVSPDKDLRQIPGTLYDFKETVEITEEEGNNWHLIQTLSGDSTDGYSGCPGIGIKRAVTLFEEHGYTWETVVETFESKGLTEEDALMNAQLAKILTTKEYDWESRNVIPWSPTRTSNGTNDGTVVQTEKA